MGRPTDDMVRLAMDRLGIDEETANATATAVPGVDGAFFFSRGTRGGGRLLVDQGLESLFAASSVSSVQHVKAFQQGRRS